MKKNHVALLAAMSVMILAGASALAQQNYGPGSTGAPAGQNFSQQPTQDQINAMMQQAQQAAQQQAQNQGQQGQGQDQPPANMPSGTPGSSELYSGQIPPEALQKATEQVRQALEQINVSLSEAEDTFKQLQDGGVKMSDVAPDLIKARQSWQEAMNALDAGDPKKAAAILQAMPRPEGKVDIAAKSGVTSDLINDVRVKMKAALAQIDKIEDPSAQTEAKAEIGAALTQLDQADQLLKAGKKADAAKIMMELRKSAPDAGAMEAGNMFDKIPASKLGPILDGINKEMTAGEQGMAQAEAKGITIDPEAKALFAKGKALYIEAKSLFDDGKTAEAAAKLKELKDLDLQNYFASFKEKMLPKDKQQSILQEGKNGVKALELTIANAKDYGIDTTELTSLLGQLKPLIDQAEAALKANNTDQFLQYMTMAENLQTGDKVDAIIRQSANLRAKSMVGSSLAMLEPGVKDLGTLISALKSKGKNTDQAQKLLDNATAMIVSARGLYDSGKYMEAGTQLDEVTGAMISLSNIFKDSGLQLTDKQKAAVNSAQNNGVNPDSMVLANNQDKSFTDLMKASSPQDRMDLSNSMLNFDPQLFDQIIASRSKDKTFIDNIMSNVMPLLSDSEKAKFMDGKLGLLDESQRADKTIAIVKQIKGVPADTFKTLASIKDQIKNYNFQPDTAATLDAKISDFNDKILSQEVKDPALIKAYVSTLQTEVNSAVSQDTAAKYKEGEIPAKNVDNNNPLYADVAYLASDGALKADAKGNIDLSKKTTKADLAKIIGNAKDAGTVNLGTGNLTLKDALTLTAKAYGVTASANDLITKLALNNPKANLNAQATLGQVAEIVAAADQRWGGGEVNK
jgi:enamine deaminase RidA (YjgF/YER057c/UK114 family)